MWFERFVIIVTSLADDYLPSSWAYFQPTWVDIGIFIGSIGLFMTLFLLFARFFPVIAIAEVKSIFRISSATAKAERAKEAGKANGGFVGHTIIGGALDKDAQ
jgi:molybdopterin-containing oxidoreductase family membrane subunit